MTVVEVHGAAPLRDGACRVIAEAGANHNNSVERAVELAERAASAGAWAVKFQMYKADRLAAKDSPKYWTDTIGTSTQHEAFQKSDHLDYDEFAAVADACRRRGIIFFATPFDLQAIEVLERFGSPIYKVASGDITYQGLLEAIEQTGKPVLLSTGASTVDEIWRAVEWLGADPARIVLLMCTLTYPAPDDDANFARIEELRREFLPYLIGTSDHTIGPAGGWMTAALGGVCIEKHYTLDKSLGDVPDHAMSVDPAELAELVAACDRGALLRGASQIAVRDSEVPARDNARRSLVTTREVPAGHQLTHLDLAAKRPGTGIPPWRIDDLVGRTTGRALRADQLVSEADLAPPVV